MISIQQAQSHDFPKIAELNVEAYDEYAESLTAETWVIWQSNLRAIEKVAQRAVFLTALVDGALAGSVAYCPAGNSAAPIPLDWASILLLAVSPHYRRRGVAQLLLQSCIQQAKQDGAQTIGLSTSELMAGAQQLYQSLGFCIDGEIPRRHGIKFWRYKLELLTNLR